MKIILFGATGMVGEGVLHEALQHPSVTSVLVVGRTSCGIHHPKLQEILHADFFNYSSIEEALTGYTGCLFCLGTTSIGKDEATYRRTTYDLTMEAARTLSRLNPGMTFCYISGAGTDSTEQGRIRWARVKGKTENDLKKLPFKEVYLFRPGFMKPTKGLKRAFLFATVLGWFYPVWKLLLSKYVVTMQDLGKAMILAAEIGYPKQVLECTDITKLAGHTEP
jgi:uncharacterized protein YbjT (DUF2867 family)